MSDKSLYRITFSHHDSVYEIYARKIHESSMFGFLEVEEFAFGENSSIVVDPTEEKLKLEFKGVKRTYIPMHAVYRIDEVSEEGIAKVHEKTGSNNKVSLFPVNTHNPNK